MNSDTSNVDTCAGRIFCCPLGFVPFLAPALSRAREYTCDRYGLAGAGDKDGAALGLTILASGGAYASRSEPARNLFASVKRWLAADS
jgi:Zn-dependent protease with chaperone function